MGNVTEVKDAGFEAEVLKSDLPVLADFYTTWCGPCKQLSPIVEELAGDYAGRLKVVKVDAGEAVETAGRLGVTSVPTLILFKDGKEVERRTGAAPKRGLVSWLDGAL